MPKDFNLVCYHCHGLLTVSDEYVGGEVQCPACEGELEVPTPAKAAKFEHVSEPVPRRLRPGEEAAIGEEDPALLALFEGATNKNCWEFALLGTLIAKHVSEGKARITIAPRYASFYKLKWYGRVPHKKLATAVKSKCEQFLSIQRDLSLLFGYQFEKTLYGNDVCAMIRFGRSLRAYVAGLCSFTEGLFDTPLPEECEYVGLLDIMRRWPDGVCDNIMALSERLQQVHAVAGTDLSPRYFQVSLVPPTLNAFLRQFSRLLADARVG